MEKTAPKKGPNRRMGPKDSETSNALLDAAEKVLREDGYASITSRSVAEAAGLKQQIVYYYYTSMDDLLLAAFKRRTERDLERLALDVASDNPIRTIWEKMNSKVDAKLAFEFVALANHHAGIREEAVRYRDVARRMEAAAISRQFKDSGADPGPLTPSAAAFLMYATSLLLTQETATGLTSGHEDVRKFFDWALNIAS